MPRSASAPPLTLPPPVSDSLGANCQLVLPRFAGKAKPSPAAEGLAAAGAYSKLYGTYKAVSEIAAT